MDLENDLQNYPPELVEELLKQWAAYAKEYDMDKELYESCRSSDEWAKQMRAKGTRRTINV